MRIGPDFRESHSLPDGSTVRLRLIRPSDRAVLRQGIRELSPESRYARFFADPLPSEEMLTYLTEVDGFNHVAIVASIDSLDLKTERAAGVGRFVRLKDTPDAAEAAITVGDLDQGKGLGQILLRALVDAARERGITRFRGEVLASNARVIHILERVGAEVRPVSADTLEFDVSIAGERSPLHETISTVLRLLRLPS